MKHPTGVVKAGRKFKNKKTLTELEDAARKSGAMAMLGFTDSEIAGALGIKPNTLAAWKKRYPIIEQAIIGARDQADAQVVDALHSRAVGYDHHIVKRREFNKDGEEVRRVEETIHVPGDVAAQQYWLNNRQQSKWRSKREEDKSEEKIFGIVIHQESQSQSAPVAVIEPREPPDESIPMLPLIEEEGSELPPDP